MPTVEELQADLSTANAELTDLRAQLSTVNGESKGHRLNAAKLKSQLETLQAEADKLTNERNGLEERQAKELDRLRIDLTAQLNAKQTELDQRISAEKDQRTSSVLLEAASKLGLGDPDYMQLFDKSGLKIAEDGSVENADEALAAFKAAKPHFFNASPGRATPSGTTSNPRPAPRPAQATIPDARTMNAQDAADLRRQIVKGTFTVA